LVTRRIPWLGMSPMQICKALMKGERPQILESDTDVDPNLEMLMRACWDDDPAVRPHFDDIINVLTPLCGQVKNQTSLNPASFPR
jgi:hypothetical protein